MSLEMSPGALYRHSKQMARVVEQQLTASIKFIKLIAERWSYFVETLPLLTKKGLKRG